MGFTWGLLYLHGYETFSNNGNLIFIDLNKFKFINDTYGHHVGDKVLIYISHFLEKLFYDAHFVRFAGDEFLLIADNSDFDAINKRIEEARYELTQKKIKATNGDLLYLNFSFGTKAFKKGERFKEIIEQADALMYQHKNEKKS
jgi:diguanylate cyclase (GGDEF)-like protein